MKIGNRWEYPVIEDDGFALTMSSTNTSLGNPSDVVSDFSYTFTLPVCAKNNNLFQQFRNLDSIVWTQSQYYHPNNSAPCFVEDDNGSLLCDGTCYLNSFNGRRYSFTLIGSLGMCMKKLINSGWDTTKADADDTYTLLPDYLQYTQGTSATTPAYTDFEILNNKTVYTSWLAAPQNIPFSLSTAMSTYDSNGLKSLFGLSGNNNVTEHRCWLSSLVGYAPTNQGLYKDDKFDSTQWVCLQNGQGVLLPLFDIPGTERSIEVGDGLTESQMCQYRSYMQQPYIYMNKLWQMYAANSQNICGYSLLLGTDWFTDDNMLIRDMVCMLKQEDDHEKATALSTSDTTTTATGYLPKWTSWDPDTNNVEGLHAVTLDHNSATFNLQRGQVVDATFQFDYTLHSLNNQYNLWTLAVHDAKMYWFMNRPLYVWGKLYDGNNNLLTTQMYSCWLLPNNQNNEGEEYTYDTGNWNAINETVFKYDAPVVWNAKSATIGSFQLHGCYTADRDLTGCKWVWSVSIQGNTNPFMIHFDEPGLVDMVPAYPECKNGNNYTNPAVSTSNVVNRISIRTATRTNTPITMEKLMKGQTPFALLLKCSKMLNLVWVIDEDNKTITVKKRSTFYSDCVAQGFRDLTPYVDFGRSYTFEPIAFTAEKLEFNYDDVQEDYMKDYKEKYGRAYGSKTIYTQDTRTKESVPMFGTTQYNKLTPSCISTSILKPYMAYNSNSNYTQKETDAMISNINDGKCANISGNFYYRRLNSRITDEMHWNNYSSDRTGNFVMINDDTDTEVMNNQYCWHNDTTVGIGIYQRPVFDIADRTETYALQFAEPAERYNYYSYDSNMKYLYDACWKNYMDDFYSIQNKLIKVYMHFPTTIYKAVRKNPLVIVQDVLYEVMTMDYDMKTNYAQMTLRQVSDLQKICT